MSTFALVAVHVTAARAACFAYRPVELEFQNRINQARTKHGLRPLTLTRALSVVSRKHSSEMASRNSLYHTPLRTLGLRITNWQAIGENVAYLNNAGSYNVAGRASKLFQMFMQSPAHRANILKSSFNHEGVGIQWSGSRLWLTETFEGQATPGSRLSIPPAC